MVQASLELPISIDELWFDLLELQEKRFSGTVELENFYNKNWKLYFYLGRLLYITGGNHSVRRWIRYVKEYIPQINLAKDNQWIKNREFKNCWEYEILSQWNTEGKIEREQIRQIVHGIIQEIFFDLHRRKIGKPKIKQEEISFPQQWILISLEAYMEESDKEWKKWKEKGVAYIDPEKSPVIKRKRELATKMSPKVYDNMVKLLESKSTIWELSEKTKKPIVDLSIALLPYFHSGIMELVEVEDWPSPEIKKTEREAQIEVQQAPLIACVDDSLWLIESLNKQVERAGWRFMGLQDPLKSISILLAKKPDIILLDLKMPVTNGYELCEIMRKMSIFKKTPIIILTGQDGLVDRVRAKMVGATDFISKSAEQGKIIKVIAKYLNI